MIFQATLQQPAQLGDEQEPQQQSGIVASKQSERKRKADATTTAADQAQMIEEEEVAHQGAEGEATAEKEQKKDGGDRGHAIFVRGEVHHLPKHQAFLQHIIPLYFLMSFHLSTYFLPGATGTNAEVLLSYNHNFPKRYGWNGEAKGGKTKPKKRGKKPTMKEGHDEAFHRLLMEADRLRDHGSQSQWLQFTATFALNLRRPLQRLVDMATEGTSVEARYLGTCAINLRNHQLEMWKKVGTECLKQLLVAWGEGQPINDDVYTQPLLPSTDYAETWRLYSEFEECVERIYGPQQISSTAIYVDAEQMSGNDIFSPQRITSFLPFDCEALRKRWFCGTPNRAKEERVKGEDGQEAGEEETAVGVDLATPEERAAKFLPANCPLALKFPVLRLQCSGASEESSVAAATSSQVKEKAAAGSQVPTDRQGLPTSHSPLMWRNEERWKEVVPTSTTYMLENIFRGMQDVIKAHDYLRKNPFQFKLTLVPNPKKLHSEGNIVLYLRTVEHKPDFIGNWKLCCAFCQLLLWMLGYENGSTHGTADSVWPPPPGLFTEEEFNALQEFFREFPSFTDDHYMAHAQHRTLSDSTDADKCQVELYGNQPLGEVRETRWGLPNKKPLLSGVATTATPMEEV